MASPQNFGGFPLTTPTGDTAHVPSQLCHAHAVCRYTTEGAAEFNGTQEHQLDGGVYEGGCARCRGKAQDAVPDAWR